MLYQRLSTDAWIKLYISTKKNNTNPFIMGILFKVRNVSSTNFEELKLNPIIVVPPVVGQVQGGVECRVAVQESGGIFPYTVSTRGKGYLGSGWKNGKCVCHSVFQNLQSTGYFFSFFFWP